MTSIQLSLQIQQQPSGSKGNISTVLVKTHRFSIGSCQTFTQATPNPITKNLNPTIVWKDGSCLPHQELRNKNHSLTGQKRTVHSRGLQNLKKD